MATEVPKRARGVTGRRCTFLDPKLDDRLEQDGFVVVPLLELEQVQRLTTFYERLGPAPGDPGVACIDTFHCFDTEYKTAVHHELESVLGPPVAELLDDFSLLSGRYIQKWPGERSGFGLHQDISVVDESEHRSVEVWCSLQDTGEENGQLWVVPGSHRWAPNFVRGIHCHPPAYQGLEVRIISRHSIPVPLKAGEAVIFLHALYHFSYMNRSSVPRLVAAVDLIPREARHLHYVENDGGTIDEFEISSSFWIDHNPFTLQSAASSLKRVGEIDPATFTCLDDNDLDRLVAGGLAVDHDPLEVKPITSDVRWCHRCGTTEDVEGPVNSFSGNVTLLCPDCASQQTGRSTEDQEDIHVPDRCDEADVDDGLLTMTQVERNRDAGDESAAASLLGRAKGARWWRRKRQ